MSTETALDRTIHLCGYLVSHASRAEVLRALTSTTIAIVADADNVQCGACQSAIVTLAQLGMHMGFSVRLVAPDVALRMPQPPWRGTTLHEVLRDAASELVPGVAFTVADETVGSDVVFAFGDTTCTAVRGWRVMASRWSGWIQPIATRSMRWAAEFPVGGLAAAVLAAAEAFKSAMRKLGPTGQRAAELAAAEEATLTLGDESTPVPSDLGRVDCVSGGAIVQATLHVLRRVPSLAARFRVIEPQALDLTNMNRYSMSRRSQTNMAKTEILTACSASPFVITGETAFFDERSAGALAPLAPRVVVGTDNIPSRWDVQLARPQWLVVGGTTEFMAMSSEHDGSAGCAGCVHPEDDGVRATIPTVSFVSYAAGLSVAARLLRHAAVSASGDSGRVSTFQCLRLDSPEGQLSWPNVRSPRCPLHCHVRARSATHTAPSKTGRRAR